MWFWGLALATHKLESVYNTGTHFAHYFLYFTLIYFILVIAYLIKAIINFSDVIEDFNHTVKSNFFPWVWKILLIFAIGYKYGYFKMFLDKLSNYSINFYNNYF